MPSKYISRRDKVMIFIKDVIMPSLAKKNVSFNKAVNVIVVHNGATHKLATQCLQAVIEAGYIKEKDNILEKGTEMKL